MTDPIFFAKTGTSSLDLPDPFACMSDMNMASLVMLKETEIIPAALAGAIGQAVGTLIEREKAPDAKRSSDYLEFERSLIELAGAEASWLHVGRSRQDMLSTDVAMWLRAGLSAIFEDVLAVREALLRLATGHVATVIPTYTHGVQAQPNSAAHYFLAFADALARVSTRLRATRGYVNRSPFGTGAGANSCFPIDRERLAALLGFSGLVENAFDANHIAPSDWSLETVSVLSILAVHAGQFAQDLHAQFVSARPWLNLHSGPMLTGVSSMMPQKRNPRSLELMREQASLTIGAGQQMMLITHNVHSGMTDVRETIRATVPFRRVHFMLNLMKLTVEGVAIDPERSLGEVADDYSTMNMVAEDLIGSAGLPFRVAYKFASALTDFGRARGLKPSAISHQDAACIYEEQTGEPFSLSAGQLAEAVDPERFIATRLGRGGPQRKEVERMLAEASDALVSDRDWLADTTQADRQAHTALSAAFAAIAGQ